MLKIGPMAKYIFLPSAWQLSDPLRKKLLCSLQSSSPNSLEYIGNYAHILCHEYLTRVSQIDLNLPRQTVLRLIATLIDHRCTHWHYYVPGLNSVVNKLSYVNLIQIYVYNNCIWTKSKQRAKYKLV